MSGESSYFSRFFVKFVEVSAAVAQLSVLQMRVLVPQFRSKIDLQPLSQLDRNHWTL